MAQSFEITSRQFKRAEEILTAAAATEPRELLAVKAMGPETLGHCQAFKVADAAVQAQERAVTKEVTEAEAASKSLRKKYDETR